MDSCVSGPMCVMLELRVVKVFPSSVFSLCGSKGPFVGFRWFYFETTPRALTNYTLTFLGNQEASRSTSRSRSRSRNKVISQAELQRRRAEAQNQRDTLERKLGRTLTKDEGAKLVDLYVSGFLDLELDGAPPLQANEAGGVGNDWLGFEFERGVSPNVATADLSLTRGGGSKTDPPPSSGRSSLYGATNTGRMSLQDVMVVEEKDDLVLSDSESEDSEDAETRAAQYKRDSEMVRASNPCAKPLLHHRKGRSAHYPHPLAISRVAHTSIFTALLCAGCRFRQSFSCRRRWIKI
jgi:hypothetical protein